MMQFVIVLFMLFHSTLHKTILSLIMYPYSRNLELPFDCIVLTSEARFKTTVLYARGCFRFLCHLGTITVTRGQAVVPLASVCHKEWLENAVA